MFQQISFHTSAAPHEVATRLRAVTMPASGLLWNWHHFLKWDGRRPPEFAGQVDDDSFRLQYLSPFLGYSARPLIAGQILRVGTGTEVRVSLRALGPAWVMLVVVAFNLSAAVREEGFTSEVLFAGAVFFTVSAAWWAAGVRRAKSVLARVLSAPSAALVI